MIPPAAILILLAKIEAIIGLPLNLFVLFIILKHHIKKQPSMLLMANQCLCDAGGCAISLSVIIPPVVVPRLLTADQMNTALRIVALFGMASNFTFLAIGVSRLLAICMYSRFVVWFMVRRVRIYIAIIWLLSFGVAVFLDLQPCCWFEYDLQAGIMRIPLNNSDGVRDTFTKYTTSIGLFAYLLTFALYVVSFGALWWRRGKVTSMDEKPEMKLFKQCIIITLWYEVYSVQFFMSNSEPGLGGAYHLRNQLQYIYCSTGRYC